MRRLDGGAVKTLVDVGANRSDMAARFAATLPGTRVLAVEPDPEVFHALQPRLTSLPRVECTCVALGEASREAELLHVDRIDAASRLLPRVRAGRRYFAANDERRKIDAVPGCVPVLLTGGAETGIACAAGCARRTPQDENFA